MRNSHYPVLHLAHPRPVSWSTIIKPLARALSLPLVPYTEWVLKLEESLGGSAHDDARDEVERMKVNPALRILDFFRGGMLAGDASREAMGMPELSLERAVEEAEALGERALPQLGEKDALSWLAYW